MSVVDLVLVLWAAASLIHGWRVGIIRGIFGFAGMLLGFWVGLKVLPFALDALSLSTIWRVVTSLAMLLTLAGAGQAVGNIAGQFVRRAVSIAPIRLVDSALGSAFRITIWAGIVWLLASTIALLPDEGVVQDIRSSRIVQVIDSSAPEAADRATAALRSALRRTSFPQVFAGVTPVPRSSVAAPDPKLLKDPQVRAAYDSVYQVIADAPSCVLRNFGTGFAIDPGHIVTNAHVVAGANSVVVRSVTSKKRIPALVVALDPELDIAILWVKAKVTPLAFADQVPVGTSAVVPGFTGGDPMSPNPARISDIMIANGHDIYGERRVQREIYVLRADIRPGDSGAPLLAADGSVLGVVFAAGAEGTSTGYALTANAVYVALRGSEKLTAPFGTGSCLP